MAFVAPAFGAALVAVSVGLRRTGGWRVVGLALGALSGVAAVSCTLSDSSAAAGVGFPARALWCAAVALPRPVS